MAFCEQKAFSLSSRDSLAPPDFNSAFRCPFYRIYFEALQHYDPTASRIPATAPQSRWDCITIPPHPAFPPQLPNPVGIALRSRRIPHFPPSLQIPTGFRPTARGCGGHAATPGTARRIIANPTGVASTGLPPRTTQPRWGCKSVFSLTHGRPSCLGPTMGLATQSRWDCITVA